ncbi:hypothetical protein JCM11251_000324 [Rhodosporidiobolus azoricus]
MQPPCRVVNLPLAIIDPSNPSSHVQQLHLSPSPPFSSGEWSLTFLPAPLKPGKYTPSTVKLAWSNCEEAAPWGRGRLCVAEKQQGKGKRKVYDLLLQPDEGRFPGQNDGELEIKVGRPVRAFEVFLDVDMQGEESSSVSRCLALVDRRYTLDVCLTFPPSCRTLWASSAMLTEASPWWKTTLGATGFSEGIGVRAPQPLQSQFDDSDDDEEEGTEDGCVPLSRLATPPPSPPLSPLIGFSTLPATSSNATSYRTIPITGTSYHTYRCFLVYLLTSQLSFAPLTSTFISPICTSWREANTARTAALLASSRLNPYLPVPVSPKSMYRLAHFLEMPSLCRFSLDALRRALSVENVAYELFGPMEEEGDRGRPLGETYEEVFEMEVRWARERWESVRGSRAMEEVGRRMREKVREGEALGEYEMETMMRLAGIMAD